MSGNFFGAQFFGGGFFGAVVTDEPSLGGKGDNERGKKRPPAIFKPTGLLDRPKKRQSVEEAVEARVEESAEIQAEVSEQSREVFFGPRVVPDPLVSVHLTDIDREIQLLLHKKLRTEEDEIMLLIFMAAAAC